MLPWIADFIVKNWRKIHRFIKARDLPPASGDRFTIIVADLENDDEKRNQTRHVADALRKHSGIAVRRYGRTLSEPDHGDDADGFAATEAEGREWLDQQNADLLIWGRVKKIDEVLVLRFLAPFGRGSIQESAYRLIAETLELPSSFREDFSTALTAIVLAAVRPITEKQGVYLVDLLRPLAVKLNTLLSQDLHQFSDEQRGTMHSTYGLTLSTIGEQADDGAALEAAVRAYNSAANFVPRERSPQHWARIKHHLGNTLLTLGELATDTGQLQSAISAFREALQERTRARAPLDWATTQVCLSGAYVALGDRSSSPELLHAAIRASGLNPTSGALVWRRR